MISDHSYLSDENSKANSTGGYVTFMALPYPLPKAWIKEFQNTENLKDVIAVEQRVRATIGIKTTRKEFPPKGY
jgi:hypothetical protein